MQQPIWQGSENPSSYCSILFPSCQWNFCSNWRVINSWARGVKEGRACLNELMTSSRCDCLQVFTVVRGKLAVTIHRTKCLLESGDMFFVPVGQSSHLVVIVTSPTTAVEKYCDECVCLSVCLSDKISPEPHAQSLWNFLCMLPVSMARSFSCTLTIGRITYDWEGVFFPVDNAL